MEYKNTKTGATFSSPCVVSGGDWIQVTGEVANNTEPLITPAQEVVPPSLPEEPQENTDDFDGITRAQIMQELDAFGIEYDKRANKQTLYDLMLAQGK